MFSGENMDKHILNIITSLHEGSNRIVCPFCEGGSSKEKSFIITKEGRNVKYMCHRASCNARGNTNYRGELQQSAQPVQAPVLTTPSEGVYALRSVRDNLGRDRGGVYRRKPTAPSQLPKDINRIDDDWCKLHFPAPTDAKCVILVEDIISAEKMHPFFPCVALLGVHLNEQKLAYLVEQGVRHVIVALDNDATRQAIRIARKWLFDTTILPLQRDLKDETYERLQEIADNLKSNQM
jgi:hypothetical protein